MIVDAFNQFIRGYIVDPSKNPNGSPIGGMRTFINILNKITREISPDMLVVVWDGKGGSKKIRKINKNNNCLLYTSPSPRDRKKCRMPYYA